MRATLIDDSAATPQKAHPDEITDLGMAWVDFIFHGPLFGSIFAFAFVIGYFYSINITWFTFFSIEEHLVFALQGLPVALGGSVILLILVSISHHSSGWGITSERKKLWLRRIGVIWMIALSGSIAYFVQHKSVAGPFCFLSLIVGVYCFTFIHSPEDKFVHVMYWGINVAVLCLLVGSMTGEIHKHYPNSLTITTKIGATKGSDNFSDGGAHMGQILFNGKAGMLFLDQNTSKIYIIQSESIAAISNNSIIDKPTNTPLPFEIWSNRLK
jgi:hypothetical protein